jgi:anti-sigma B factor antagonist
MEFSYLIEIRDSILVIKVSGKILSEEQTKLLDRELSEKVNEKLYNVIIDFANLEHINSVGIGFLIRCLTKARVHSGDLVICHVQGNVLKLFEIAKLNQILIIHPSLEDAINFLNK